jgi:hypothetical protein
MKKKLFFSSMLLIMVIISNIALGQQPRLLWKKTFDRDINSVSVSSDGTKIVICTDPDLRGTFEGSKLLCFDKFGNLLWQYEVSNPYMVINSKIANNNRVYCAKYKRAEWTETLVDIDLPEGGTTSYTSNNWVYGVVSLLCFDITGRLLWEKEVEYNEGRGIEISDDGNYILFYYDFYGEDPDISDEVLEQSEGQSFWLINSSGEVVLRWNNKKVRRSSGNIMSNDGKYIGIGNVLYDNKGSTVTIFSIDRTEINDVSPLGNYVMLRSYDSLGDSKDRFLCRRDGSLIKKYEGDPFFDIKFSYDEKYFLSNQIGGDLNLFVCGNGNLLWRKTHGKIYRSGYFSKDNRFIFGVFSPYHEGYEDEEEKSDETTIFCYKIDGTLIWEITLPGVTHYRGPFDRSMDFSYDAKYIAVATSGSNKKLYFFDNSEFVK